MKTDFAAILSRLRRDSGLSQKKTADDLGISQALLSHYENGVREPKLEFILKACDYYGVTADHILGRTPDRKKSSLFAPDITTTEERRCWDAAVLISSVLAGIGDEELRRAAARYGLYGLYVVLSALRLPPKPYEPLFDAAAKTAESRFFDHAKRAAENADTASKLTDEALKAKYPELYKTLIEIDGLVADTIAGIRKLNNK